MKIIERIFCFNIVLFSSVLATAQVNNSPTVGERQQEKPRVGAPALLACHQEDARIVSEKGYTLRQLKDSALRNNVAMRSAEQRSEAFTNYFPNVSGTALWFNANRGMAKMEIDPSDVIPSSLAPTLAQMLPAEALAALNSPFGMSMMKNGTMASITAMQPVFAGGQIVNGNHLARVGEEVSRLKLQLTENEVERQTEQYYWQLVSLQEKLKTIAAVESLLDDIHKDVDVAVRAGVTLNNDLLQVQLRQNDVESQKLKLKNGISILQMLLAQYCGISSGIIECGTEDVDWIVASVECRVDNADNNVECRVDNADNNVECRMDNVEFATAQRTAAEGSAVANSTLSTLHSPLVNGSKISTLNPPLSSLPPSLFTLPEYQLLEKQVEAATLQKRMAVGKNLPTLALGAGYNYHNLMDNDRTFGMVFATISLPVSDWWGGSHAIKRRKLEQQKAIDRLNDNAQLLQIRMQKTWNDVVEARQQLLLAQRSIEQAEENLRLQRNYYSAGTSTMSNLLEAQLLYQQTLDKRVDAYAALQTCLLDYRQATGK